MKKLSLPNIINATGGYLSTASSAGTLTLTIASEHYQNISGTSTHTVVLPNATTLAVGHSYAIANNSTGAVTLNVNGGTLLKTIAPGNSCIVVCTSVGTSAGVWTVHYSVDDEDYIVQNANRNLTSTTNVQKIFNTATNGACAVKASYLYFIEAVIVVSSMSGTSGNFKFDPLGAGTATLTSNGIIALGGDLATLSTAAAAGVSYNTATPGAGNVVTAAVNTNAGVYFRGMIKTNAAGTLIPSLGLTTAASAVLNLNSWLILTPKGPAATNFTPNWT